MPTSEQKKVVVSRALSTYLFENAGLLLWLVKSYVSNKINFTVAQLLLTTNGIKSNIIGLIGEISKEAIKNEEDTRRDLMLLGLRAFTIQVVVTPSSIKDAYNLPLRNQFLMVSALLDGGYGSHSFIHKSAGFFEEDKRAFKTALFNGSETFRDKIRDYLKIELEDTEVWKTTSVFDMVRRVAFVTFAETFLGVSKERLLSLYKPLTESLDMFENMWQHPDQFNPFVMFTLYQRLNRISNELHEHRSAAELPDAFARRYNRPMNVTAIFLVASNLVHFMTAAILHQCTNNLGPELTDTQLDDLAKEVATWRFRDSRIYRFDAGLFFSNAPQHTVGGNACEPRTLTIIPQGDINNDRIRNGTYLKDDGRIKDPELFGRARPCPGSSISYGAVKSVFFAVTAKEVIFVPDAEKQAAYNRFVEDRTDWENGHGGIEEPKVTGRWMPQNY